MAGRIELAGQPGHRRARRPGCQVVLLVCSSALLIDTLAVEQERGVLGHEADPPDPLLGREADRWRALDRGGTARGLVDASQAAEQGRLARAVASHHRRDGASPHLEVDPIERQRAPVRGAEPIRDRHHLAATDQRRGDRFVAESSSHCTRSTSRVADGHRQRRPASEPAEVDDRRCQRRRGHHDTRLPHLDGAGAIEQHHPIGEGEHPLKTVLGEHHRQTDVVDEPSQARQHFLGGTWVEG